MGGPEGRVYWPPGMEHWLRPVKKVIKPKEPKAEGDANKKLTPAQKKKNAAAEAAKEGAKVEDEVNVNGIKAEADTAIATTPTPASKKAKAPLKPKANGTKAAAGGGGRKGGSSSQNKQTTPEMSDGDDDDDQDVVMSDLHDEEEEDDDEKHPPKKAKTNGAGPGLARRQSGRAKKISYKEGEGEDG
ncbi:MAG: hypothetical protein Q9164_007481 [Protoblastenia rupestris]